MMLGIIDILEHALKDIEENEILLSTKKDMTWDERQHAKATIANGAERVLTSQMALIDFKQSYEKAV